MSRKTRRKHSQAARDNRARRRLIRTIIVADVIIVGLVAFLWISGRAEAPSRTDGLRGSIPPSEQALPSSGALDELEPPLPSSDSLTGNPTVIAVTCIDCQSGSIIGGFLTRLTEAIDSNNVNVVVIAYGGELDPWENRWGLTDTPVHYAETESAKQQVLDEFKIGESGLLRVYDSAGIWQSTFHAGQINLDDLEHDLRELSQES